MAFKDLGVPTMQNCDSVPSVRLCSFVTDPGAECCWMDLPGGERNVWEYLGGVVLKGDVTLGDSGPLADHVPELGCDRRRNLGSSSVYDFLWAHLGGGAGGGPRESSGGRGGRAGSSSDVLMHLAGEAWYSPELPV